MRVCVVCGASLEGQRSDARHCGGPCRAEASRLRRILDGNAGPYASIRQRMFAFSRSHPLRTESRREQTCEPQSLERATGALPNRRSSN